MRAPLSRAAIVQAAREMITEEGLDAVSLRRLAAHLQVTAPALYAHVEDKEDLLRAVAEVEFLAMIARFEEVPASEPVARMRALSRAYIAHARAVRSCSG
ncbi:MAG: helix-turn-helix domain-containing protein [Acidimicrobiales bacterium]